MSSNYVQPINSHSPSDQDLSQNIVFEPIEDRRLWRAEQILMADWFADESADGRILRPGFAMDRLAPLIGFIHKLEASEDKSDFRYKIYGGRVAEFSNMDLTGHWISHLKTVHREAFLNHYLSIVENPAPFIGLVHIEGDGLSEHDWYRVVLPIGTSIDAVTGMLVLAMPVSAAGISGGTS